MDDDFWVQEEDDDTGEQASKRARRAQERSMSPFECVEAQDDADDRGDMTSARVVEDRDEDCDIRQSCLQEMSSPDAVMNHNVHQVIQSFLQSGGAPEKAVDQLVDSYVGAADNCKLLSHWLQGAGEDPDALLMQFFHFMVKDRFNALVVDNVFERRLSAPQWLEGMLGAAEWRRALYELGASHNDSTLLKYAMQRVVEAGLHAEQLAGPRLASNYFPLFISAFSNHVKTLLALENDALTCANEFSTFLNLCLASHQSYIYAQALLVLLLRDPSHYEQSSCYQRLLEELEVAAMRRGLAKVALRTSYLYHVMALNANTAYQQNAAQVQAALQTMLVTGSTNPVDIGKLHGLYNGENGPPVEYIQNADFLELLLNDLFNPTKSVPLQHKPKYLFLLAKACATKCVRQQSMPPGTPGCSSDFVLFSKMNDGSVNEDASGVPSIQQALDSVLALTESLEADQISVPAFKPYLRYAVVSMGLIKWIDRKMQHLQGLWEMPSSMEGAVPALLRLLAEIARTHSNQWPSCFDLLVKYFAVVSDAEWEPTARVGYLKMLLTGILYLAKLGYVLPVLNAFFDWLQNRTLDMSLIRIFLYRLLSMSQPPYSVRFVAAFIPIILDSKVAEAISSSSLASSPVPHLVEFLQYIMKSGAYNFGNADLVRLRHMQMTLSVLPG